MTTNPLSAWLKDPVATIDAAYPKEGLLALMIDTPNSMDNDLYIICIADNLAFGPTEPPLPDGEEGYDLDRYTIFNIPVADQLRAIQTIVLDWQTPLVIVRSLPDTEQTPEINITPLEQEVIDAANQVDSPEYFFSTDIFGHLTKLKAKQARGALSSLIQKGIIYIDQDEKGLVTILKPEYFNFKNA